jgi:hypothetical protein
MGVRCRSNRCSVIESPKIVASMTHAAASSQLAVAEAGKLSAFLNHQRKMIKVAERKQKWGELE